MKDFYYTYNNEAIASCIILNVLKRVDQIDLARACLILPILLDDRTVKYLDKVIDHVSIESVVKQNPRLFISFNQRYLTLLPITINSIMILSQSNQIEIASTISVKYKVTSPDIIMGDRFDRINKILPTFLKIIESYSTTQLYQILKVQL